MLIPKQSRNGFEMTPICQHRRVLPPVVEPAALDQTQGRVEHGCRRIERFGRRSGSAPGTSKLLQPVDILFVIAPLAATGLPLSAGSSCCSQDAKKLFRSSTSQRSKPGLL